MTNERSSSAQLKHNLSARQRVVSASGSETKVSGSTPTSVIIYDAYSSIVTKRGGQRVRLGNEHYEFDAYQRHYL